MSLINLPAIAAPAKPKALQWDAPSDVLTRWAERPLAAEADDPNTISIYDLIGEDWWSGGGFTSGRMAAALRRIGPNAVTVNLNSPGGDMFEGIAIYNLLREHPARVTVKVMALAASAASVIAMAGDEVMMGTGSFLMIHNSWGVVVGNRRDMGEAVQLFEQFDSALTDIYVARTGAERQRVVDMMDAETFMAASMAIDEGFATGTFDAAAGGAAPSSASASAELLTRRRIEAAMAKDGIHRGERSRMLAAITGERDAARLSAARDAGDINAALLQLAKTMTP